MNPWLLRAITVLIWFAIALTRPSVLLADDGLIAAPAGGLSFAPDPALRFLSETLKISSDSVEAIYNISNPTDQVRKVMISARLPDLDMADVVNNQLQLADKNNINFVGFDASIDGRSLDVVFERRAIALGLDVTTVLNDLKIPLGPDFSKFDVAVSGLASKNRSALLERGIIQIEDGDLIPAWVLKTTLYWMQSFSASSVMEISMKYVPVKSVVSYTPQRLAQLEDEYCINDSTKAAIEVRSARGGGAPEMIGVVYSLTQGAHWNKPTSMFQLVVEKEDASVVLATCIEGFSKINALQMEKTIEDHIPSDDFYVLFVR